MQRSTSAPKEVRSATHSQMHHPTRMQVPRIDQAADDQPSAVAEAMFLRDSGVAFTQTHHIGYLGYGCSCKATFNRKLTKYIQT